MRQERGQRERPGNTAGPEAAEQVVVEDSNDRLLTDVDRLLDDIDAALEAQAIVIHFRQRSGQ